MACTMAAPCGGILRTTLVLPDRTLFECLCAHTHIVRSALPCEEAQRAPRDEAEEPRVRREERPCDICTRPLGGEACGRHGVYKRHVACREAGRKRVQARWAEARRKGPERCRLCRKDLRCKLHAVVAAPPG